MSNIRVAVRVRPLSQKEKDDGSKEIVVVNDNAVRIQNVKVLGIPEFVDSRARVREFAFDHCYDCMVGHQPFASQAQVFQDLGHEVLHSAYDGFNACVFAYGQTGTGKTHTMMGYPGDVGLIPRICEGLFSHVSTCNDEHVSFRVDISYYEIYNERVRDLLQPESFRNNEKFSLKVREHPKEGPYVKDLSWHRVRNDEEIQALLEKGNEHRVTAETYIHDRSSRSHAIVTVCFTQARLESDQPSEMVSKIHLVDLAGSERADPSSKPDFRKRLTEGANINKSLVTLGYVIKALAERSLLSWSTDEMGSIQNFQTSAGGETMATGSPSGPNKQRVPYIPYRDSVLTWLLKDSLGGNSKTIMIATITPASNYYSESLSTLRYAQRAKNIINKPRVNEDTNVALIRELRREIERLHGMLASAQKGSNLLTLPDSEDSMLAEKLYKNEEMAKQLTQSWMCKWASTHDIMKDSDLSIRGLRNRTSSMGVMIDSQLPYLVGMDDDILSTGVVMFHLKEGETMVGQEDAEMPPDIVLSGANIQQQHCIIHNAQGEVTLHPLSGSLCSVQGQECLEPTKLSQGDFVVLGGNQVFRFNNPMEAAKLREHRRSQEGSLNTLSTSQLSFGALSRASSFNSLGGDDGGHGFLSPHSQLLRSYPNYAAPDLCRELEKKHQSEHERIDEANKELARLKAEHERAEELRQEREEEMYRSHEEHRQEIEDQRRHLARLIEENERARSTADEELTLARDSLVKEKEAFQKELDAERRRLKLEQQQESLAVQTDPLSTMSTGAGPGSRSTVSTGMSASTTSTSSSVGGSVGGSVGDCDRMDGHDDMDVDDDGDDTFTDEANISHRYAGGRRMSAEDQLKELEQNEFTRRMSYRETEQSLSIQEEDIEDLYQSTQEQIEDKIRQIHAIEEEYKLEDQTHLQEIAAQAERLQALHKQEVQLEVYIQENEELMNVCSDVPHPLRSATSELFLQQPNLSMTEYPQKTSSLQDIQAGTDNDQVPKSPRLFQRSASAESLESSVSEVSMESKELPNGRSRDSKQDKRKKEEKKDSKISAVAKDVTSRLYQVKEPKFKYVPKTKEKEVKVVPRTRVARDRDVEPKQRSSPARSSPARSSPARSSPARSSPARSVRDSEKRHSPSPLRQTGKRTSPSPGREIESKKKVSGTPQKDKDTKTKPGSKSKDVKKDGNDTKSKDNAGDIMKVRNKAQGQGKNDVGRPEGGAKRALSPDKDRLNVSGQGGRLGASGKIRHVTSASSLASVPETVREEGNEDAETDSDSNVLKPEIYVVKMRAKRGRAALENESRSFSAPDSEKMADALEKYSQEMSGNPLVGFRSTEMMVPTITTSISNDESERPTDNIDSDPNNDIDAGKEVNMQGSVENIEQVDGYVEPESIHIHQSSADETKMDTDNNGNDNAKKTSKALLDSVSNFDPTNAEFEGATGPEPRDFTMDNKDICTDHPENTFLGKRDHLDELVATLDTRMISPTKKSKSRTNTQENCDDRCEQSGQDDREKVSESNMDRNLHADWIGGEVLNIDNSELGTLGIVKAQSFDDGMFSEDSLDSDASSDSLERERKTGDRLTQSLPIHFNEKPLSDDSLNDSLEDANRTVQADKPENSDSEALLQVEDEQSKSDLNIKEKLQEEIQPNNVPAAVGQDVSNLHEQKKTSELDVDNDGKIGSLSLSKVECHSFSSPQVSDIPSKPNLIRTSLKSVNIEGISSDDIGNVQDGASDMLTGDTSHKSRNEPVSYRESVTPTKTASSKHVEKGSNLSPKVSGAKLQIVSLPNIDMSCGGPSDGEECADSSDVLRSNDDDTVCTEPVNNRDMVNKLMHSEHSGDQTSKLYEKSDVAGENKEITTGSIDSNNEGVMQMKDPNDIEFAGGTAARVSGVSGDLATVPFAKSNMTLAETSNLAEQRSEQSTVADSLTKDNNMALVEEYVKDIVTNAQKIVNRTELNIDQREKNGAVEVSQDTCEIEDAIVKTDSSQKMETLDECASETMDEMAQDNPEVLQEGLHCDAKTGKKIDLESGDTATANSVNILQSVSVVQGEQAEIIDKNNQSVDIGNVLKSGKAALLQSEQLHAHDSLEVEILKVVNVPAQNIAKDIANAEGSVKLTVDELPTKSSSDHNDLKEKNSAAALVRSDDPNIQHVVDADVEMNAETTKREIKDTETYAHFPLPTKEKDSICTGDASVQSIDQADVEIVADSTCSDISVELSNGMQLVRESENLSGMETQHLLDDDMKQQDKMPLESNAADKQNADSVQIPNTESHDETTTNSSVPVTDSESISKPKTPDSESIGQPKTPDSESIGKQKTPDSESIGKQKTPDSENIVKPETPRDIAATSGRQHSFPATICDIVFDCLTNTRSLGVCTSDDLMSTLEQTDRDKGHGSDDSYMDSQEELQILKEALEQLPAKASGSGPQLSTARRATRQRAMLRQQQRAGDSDEHGSHVSDESPASGNHSKSSSRPGSGSHRRKRPLKTDKTVTPLNERTSDDYDSSENDSFYSNDSIDGTREALTQNGFIPNGKVNREREESEIGREIADNLEGSEDMPTRRRRKHGHHSPKVFQQRSLDEDVFEGPDGRRSIGIQTHGLTGRILSHAGSTRSDLSDIDISFASELEGRNMVVSPLSLWNTNDRSESDSRSDRNSTSSAGVVRNINDLEKSMTPTPRSSCRSNTSSVLDRSSLDRGPTEVWSSSTSDLGPVPGFREELSYVMETETMSPGASSLDYTEDDSSHVESFVIEAPTEGETIKFRPECSTPTNANRRIKISFPENQLNRATNLETNTPVTFEVTVHEDNTNIQYNVETTEYKTYALRNENETEPKVIPDTIHVNLNENVLTQRQEWHETNHTEHVKLQQNCDKQDSEEDNIVQERSFRSSCSSERELGFENGAVKNDNTKESKEKIEERTSYVVPSRDNVSESLKRKEAQLQHSGLVETTDYPSNDKSTGETSLGNKTVDEPGASLDESDYTSDYGTITSIDGRKGCISFTSDSEENDSMLATSPVISPRASHVTNNKQTSPSAPAVQTWINQHQDGASNLPLQNVGFDNPQQGVSILPAQAENVCPGEEVQTPVAVAGTTHHSFPHQHVSFPVDNLAISELNKPDSVDSEQSDKKENTEKYGYESSETRDNGEDIENSDLKNPTGNEEEEMETDSSSVSTVVQQKDSANKFHSQDTLDDLDQDNTGICENAISISVNEIDHACNPEVIEKFTDKVSEETQTSELSSQMSIQPENTHPVEAPVQKEEMPILNLSDDKRLSLEKSDTSSSSSEYKTPQQSPRDDEEIENISNQVADVVVPDLASSDQSPAVTPRHDMNTDIGPVKKSSDVKTVSVNTESLPPAGHTQLPESTHRMPNIRNQSDPVQTDELRKELEKKIARLQHPCRSLSDSAISSDFTDADSSSLSPRTSRFYDSDRASNIEKRLQHSELSNYCVGALGLSPSASRLKKNLDFEPRTVGQCQFKDSGNVFDEEDADNVDSSSMVKHVMDECTNLAANGDMSSQTKSLKENFVPLGRPVKKFPENMIGALLAIKPFPLQRSVSFDSISSLVNMGTQLSRAVRESPSVENPGDQNERAQNAPSNERMDKSAIDDRTEPENKATTVVLDDNQNIVTGASNQVNVTDENVVEVTYDVQMRPLSPGEIGLSDDSIEDMANAVDEEFVSLEMAQSAEFIPSNRKISEKSTSMSVLDNGPDREYRRSLSEGNIDDFEDDHESSINSNDSITFVFMSKYSDENKYIETEEKGDLSDGECKPEQYDSESQSPEVREMSVSPQSEFYDSEEYPIEYNLGPDGFTTDSSETDDSNNSPRSAALDNEDQQSTHSASEEIEEIINKNVSEGVSLEPRDIAKNYQPDLPKNQEISYGLLQNTYSTLDDEDSAPLRHKFGIDESVLPIPDRPMSADNFPKRAKFKELQRSRSTGMLDVGVADESESESGIFPPAPLSYDNDEDEDQTDNSASFQTTSEGKQISRTADAGTSQSDRASTDLDTSDIGNTNSARAASIGSFASSTSLEEFREEIVVEYKSNRDSRQKHTDRHARNALVSAEQNEEQIREVLRTVEHFLIPRPLVADRGTSMDDNVISRLVSRGIQTSNSNINTQTTESATSGAANIQPNQIILPALFAPFRSQSMESFGLGSGNEELQLSEGASNWCTLGELMVETTQLLRRINDRLPDLERSGSISSSEESQAIMQQWQEISIQTGHSLNNLNTVGLQTEEREKRFTDAETNAGNVKTFADSTQVETKFKMEPLEASETVTLELLPCLPEAVSCEMSVQTDVSMIENIPIQSHDSEEIANCRQSDIEEFNVTFTRSGAVPSELSLDTKGKSERNVSTSKTAPGPAGDIIVKDVQITVNAAPQYSQQGPAVGTIVSSASFNEQQQHGKQQKPTETQARYIPQIKAELGLNGKSDANTTVGPDSNKTKYANEKKAVESKSVPGVTLSNTSEIEELRQEHAKLMENLKKASEERHKRKEAIKARKQVSTYVPSMYNPDGSLMESKVDGPIEQSDLSETKSSGKDHLFLDNSIDRELMSSEQNTSFTDETVSNISSITSPSSPQEFVQINIQIDPNTGLSVENKTFKENSPKKHVSKRSEDSKHKTHGGTQEHIWQMTGDSRKTQPDDRLISNRIGSNIERTESEASVSSHDTAESSEVAKVMAGGVIDPNDVLPERGGALNPMFLREDLVDDVLGDDLLTPRNDSGVSPEPVLDHMTKNLQLKAEHIPIDYERLMDNRVPRETVEETITPAAVTRNKTLPKTMWDEDQYRNQSVGEDPRERGRVVKPFIKSETSPKFKSQLQRNLFPSGSPELAETEPYAEYPVERPSKERNGTEQVENEIEPPYANEQAIVPSVSNRSQMTPSFPSTLGDSPNFDQSDDATQVSIDISDDFTQTDPDTSVDTVIQVKRKDSSEIMPVRDHGRTLPESRDGKQKPENETDQAHQLTEDLERLHGERLEIIELLSLKYLPTSLTVELLEAKLNYCIGQTDLLLDNFEEGFGSHQRTIRTTSVKQNAKDYISQYRADLKKSKEDIAECRERLNRTKPGRGVKPGAGRGRSDLRRSDIYNRERRAQVEAFQLERMREQQDYDRSKHGSASRTNTPRRGNTPLYGNSPVVTPRSSERSRSSSPAYSPGYMTPSEHKAHLVDLRRQLITDVVEEEKQYRSCSPSPVSMRHSQHRNRSPGELGYSPKVSVSMNDSRERIPDHYRSYVVAPGMDAVASNPASAPPTHHLSPHRYRPLSSPSRHPLTSSLDTRMTAESIFSARESEQILREIEEIQKRTPNMSTPMEEMLRRSSFSSNGSHRSSRNEPSMSPRTRSLEAALPRHRSISPVARRHDMPLTLDLDDLRDDDVQPYSPYSAYAREHVLPNERPLGGVLHGTYELYGADAHDRSDTSSVLSFGSDIHPESHQNVPLDEETIKRLRPISSSDIKAKLGRHKR